MLRDPAGFGCTLRNLVGVRTHESGTIIDIVALSGDIGAKVDVVESEGAGLVSDHSRVDVKISGRMATGSPKVGRSKWRAVDHTSWDEALSRLLCRTRAPSGC